MTTPAQHGSDPSRSETSRSDPSRSDPSGSDQARSPQVEDPDVALVLASYTAFARGDIDAAVAPMTDRTEWVEPDDFPMGGRRVGRAAVAEYLRASRDSWLELTSTPTASRVGDHIVVVHAISGTLLDGSASSLEVADVFTVQDGQVLAMHATLDIAAALRGDAH